MKLAVVIPAHNEEGCIEATIVNLNKKCVNENIDHEIVVVNDHSTDQTQLILENLQQNISSLRIIQNDFPNGFGFAVRKGLEEFDADVVAVYMADASDTPENLIDYYRTLISRNVDCVFGTRFHSESKVIEYPKIKLIINRIANFIIKILFGIRYNDITNAFKMYRREVILGLKPFLSHHFNLTVELPLKAIVRGYSYTVVPNDWINRKSGESKLKIKEMGSRYMFIMLYCLIEKYLSRGDYHRSNPKLDLIHQKNRNMSV